MDDKYPMLKQAELIYPSEHLGSKSAIEALNYGADSPVDHSSQDRFASKKRTRAPFSDFDDDSSGYSYLLDKERLAYQLGRSVALQKEEAAEWAGREDELAAAASEIDASDYAEPLLPPPLPLPLHQMPHVVHLVRMRRSAPQPIGYESSYGEADSDEPCFGFPLEINVKSRIKPEDVFPIRGKSQFKKCIKLE